eukprot:EG_transcript_18795
MLSSLSLPCGANVRVEWTGSRAARTALKLLQSHHRQLAIQVGMSRLEHPTPSSPTSSDSSVGTHGPFGRSPPLTPAVAAPHMPPRWSCGSIDCHLFRLIMKTDAIAEL